MNDSSSAMLTYLDQIPDKIYQRLITHQYRLSCAESRVKSLQQRAQGVLEIRQQLLKGQAVTRNALLSWLDEDRVNLFFEKFNNKILLSNTTNNESYTDDILLQVLNWLDRREDGFHIDESLDQEAELFSPESSNLSSTEIDVSMQEINNGFALERQLGWDLSTGVESKTDLVKLIEIHNVVKKSKKLQSIIRLIGRSKIEKVDKCYESGLNNTRIQGPFFQQSLPDDRSLNSVTGVCLGDDISRMLSSELMLLANKKLKILWHARRAERQLLNYHYQGLLSDHAPTIMPESLDFDKKSNQPIVSQGPLLLCVDTSSSMQGRLEIMSKAIAYEVMRIAHLQDRDCILFCFSGANEINQLDLNLNNGWASILHFLSRSFNGGTDINTVIKKVLEEQKKQKWQHADVILISDGIFSVDDKLLLKLTSKASKLKIFGVQLGKWSTYSLSAICHIVFDLSDV